MEKNLKSYVLLNKNSKSYQQPKNHDSVLHFVQELLNNEDLRFPRKDHGQLS